MFFTEGNWTHLTGRVLSKPIFSHKTNGCAYYMLILGILRKSGYEDRIRLIISEYVLGSRSPKEGEFLKIDGQIRTYNREENGRSKLEVFVFVREIYRTGIKKDIYENEVNIDGFLCKPPIRRTSPLGRELCDLMIAVNRPHNKSDYIPAIAWGRNAAKCEYFCVGDRVFINGRIQSRDYRKHTLEGSVLNKTAYEVSVVSLELYEEVKNVVFTDRV